jgi:hypothetical protein
VIEPCDVFVVGGKVDEDDSSATPTPRVYRTS